MASHKAKERRHWARMGPFLRALAQGRISLLPLPVNIVDAEAGTVTRGTMLYLIARTGGEEGND